MLVKDESARFGLPAFKALGAFWAAQLGDRRPRPGGADAGRGDRGQPRPRGGRRRPPARRPRAHRHPAAHTAAPRADAIVAEGAVVERIQGGYEDAVAHAAALADGDRLVISDTGAGEITAARRRGLRDAVRRDRRGRSDLVVVPIGVGSLAAAAARHFRPDGPFLLGLEPADAACALASARAGRPVTLSGPMRSTMAGLNCAEPSPGAWPLLAPAYDAFCSIGEDAVDWGVRRLAAEGLDRGACSGGVLGGLREHRDALDLPPNATALLILTEGVTDLEVFEAAVGRQPKGVRHVQ